MLKRIVPLVLLATFLAVPVWAGSGKEPPEGYKKVSTLVQLPDFLPGMGTLYVKPDTLPVGPFLAYDRDGKLVSTVYMIPMTTLDGRKDLTGLPVGNNKVEKVDVTYNYGHAGVAEPHYHVTIWHVKPEQAKLK